MEGEAYAGRSGRLRAYNGKFTHLTVPRILPSAFLTGCFISLIGGAPGTASVDSCIARREPHWKADEVRVWAALCRGQNVDFQPLRGTVSGAFLREVLSTRLSAAWSKRLQVSHVVVEGKTDWSGLEVNHEVRILDSTFQKAIDGSHATFKRSVCLQGSDLLGGVDFTQSQIDGGLYLGDEEEQYRCGAEPFGLIPNVPRRRIARLNLNSLTAKDDIYVRNFITDKIIEAVQAESQKNIFFWYCSAAGILLSGARTGRQINIVDCSVRNANVTGVAFAVQLEFAQSKEGIYLTRSKLFGRLLLTYVNCSFIDMRGTQLQSIELREAVVSTSLEFGWVRDPDREPAVTRWEPYKDSWMNLQDTKLGSLVVALPRDGGDVTRFWPEFIESLGMTYERFYGKSDDVTKAGGGTVVPVPLSYKTYVEFLAKQRPFSETAYRFLGNFLVNSGEDTKGRSILYAGRVAARQENFRRAGSLDLTAYTGWFESFLLDLTIGYGYYIYRVVFWIFLFVAVGAGVFRTSPEARENQMPYGIAYSVEMLLPVVKLRKLHSEIVLKGWRRYYFYFHKISGYVLAAFVAAGLSGITK